VDVRRGEATNLTLILKEKSADKTFQPGRPIASVSELNADVPAKARAEFERASKAAKEGKTEDAIKHLRRAIEVHADFMMAHNDLGALLMDQGHLDEAIAEFLRALEIDRKAFNPCLNLGVAYLRQQRLRRRPTCYAKRLHSNQIQPRPDCTWESRSRR
jgi:tetratricopeptide (TPR) repeat protein